MHDVASVKAWKLTRLHQPVWTGWGGLLFGLTLAGAALGVRLLADTQLENRFPFSAFTLITAITAWVAGWRNAAITHVAGLLAADWFFVRPRHQLFELTPESAWGVFFYLSIGLVICLFTARWQASVRRAEREIAAREEAQQTLLAAQAELKAYAAGLEDRVTARTQQLRDALGRLRSFTYSMVHDMRAPLRAMASFGKLLATEENDPETRRDYARRVCESAQRLDDLIADLQGYSETAAGDVRIERVELEALLDDVLEEYPKLAAARDCIHVHRPLPAVCGNAALLAQSLAHVLENALKFIPSTRAPRVDVKCERRERAARIWIEDNGIGIAPEYHERIFRLFEQLSGPAAGRGTGVGLAIARRAVEKMGGTIGLESRPGEGSRFWIELTAATLLSPPCPSFRTSARMDDEDLLQNVQLTPVDDGDVR